MKSEKMKDIELVVKFWLTTLDYHTMLECKFKNIQLITNGQRCLFFWEDRKTSNPLLKRSRMLRLLKDKNITIKNYLKLQRAIKNS